MILSRFYVNRCPGIMLIESPNLKVITGQFNCIYSGLSVCLTGQILKVSLITEVNTQHIIVVFYTTDE